MVLNPCTDLITPQQNVVFDNYFAIFSTNEENLPDFNAQEWSQIFGTTISCIPAFKENINDAYAPLVEEAPGILCTNKKTQQAYLIIMSPDPN